MVKRSTRLAKRNEYLDVEQKVKEALGSRKDAAAAAANRQVEQKAATSDTGSSPRDKKESSR
jgi:hypothetical protein